MLVTAQGFWVPKHGNTHEEYEDAFWPDGVGAIRDVPNFRCAVADGATETSFSAAWASLLTRRWCEERIGLRRFLRSLPELADQWRREVGDAPLPWYAEEKVRAGAFSSLLGLVLHDVTAGRDWPSRWEAVAIGDSCLFQLRGDRLITTFPLAHSEDFNSRPFLLGSASPDAEEIGQHLSILGGEFRVGDVFYLMTDALACWFLRLHEEEGSAVEFIADIREQKRFAGFVQEWRAERDAEGRPYLRNDDVTLLRLEIEG